MLYHFSEESSIPTFIPREKQNRPEFPAVVWAIDEESEYSYYFPRDCPRIILRKTVNISDEDQKLFFNHTDAAIIITVECDWYTRIANQTLYRYMFNEDGFELIDKTAGYYISHETTEPVRVDEISHLMSRLLSKGIELRFTTNLYPLRDAILASDYEGFGIYRFHNAKKP